MSVPWIDESAMLVTSEKEALVGERRYSRFNARSRGEHAALLGRPQGTEDDDV